MTTILLAFAAGWASGIVRDAVKAYMHRQQLERHHCYVCGEPATVVAYLDIADRRTTIAGCLEHAPDVGGTARSLWDGRDEG